MDCGCLHRTPPEVRALPVRHAGDQRAHGRLYGHAWDADDDGCSAICEIECGNGEIDGTEECDDGNFIDADGCEGDCTITTP